MNTTDNHDDTSRPAIVIGRSDQSRLNGMAMSKLISAPRTASALLQEIQRATVVADDAVQPTVVAIGSRVTFRVGNAGPSREVVLVDEFGSPNTGSEVAVFSNLGAALIGLSKGQRIRWPDRVGGSREITILDVRPPALKPVNSARNTAEPNMPSPLEPKEPTGMVLAFHRPNPHPDDDPPPPRAA